MSKHTWVFACTLSVLALVGFISLSTLKQYRLNQSLKKELIDSRTVANEATSRANQLGVELEDGKARIEALQRENAEASNAQKSMETEMRAALESKEVTISQLQGRLTVNILDRILFDSGEATVKPEGEKVLQQIASVLTQFPKRQINVVGHTDNVPIRAGSRGQHATNWELSTARATAALRMLSERAGVDPRRLAAVGYGEFHPIADNATTEGRAKNRRIALVVLPEEFEPSDVNSLSTNSPALKPETTATNDPSLLVPSEKLGD